MREQAGRGRTLRLPAESLGELLLPRPCLGPGRAGLHERASRGQALHLPAESHDGTLRCDIYSKSRDFLWLAGRDAFLAVSASDGEWVATLIVRWFGFDLQGVPDGDDARRAGLRSSLGSLKREAEALFRTRGASPRTIEGHVPEFEVRGGQ